MLEKAKQREIYDEVHCSEILAYLSKQSRKYDLVVAADVLVYFGDLMPIFRLVRQALTESKGSFCFSAEVTETGEYLLQRTGRYAHSSEYLNYLADASGFTPEIKTCILRKEGGLDVQGLSG
jgi:predicted TPR repeat methyltransferase